MVQIAIIGDIHRHFNAADVAAFNQSDYDLILVTGDLADFSSQDALQVADLLAQLNKPALLIGGNHDCTSTVQFIAEIKGMEWLAQRNGAGQKKRVEELREHLGTVILAGYSGHDFSIRGQDFTVIGARPFSPGGRQPSLRPYLRNKFGINSIEDSTRRLRQLVDKAAHNRLLFLAHNGPAGLGSRQDDIWGCDFQDEGGDFGDPDLAEVIDYAQEQGKQVTAVIAGHMHQELMDGSQRKWLVEDGGTTYINAARVPRIFEGEGKTFHHHLAMTLEEGKVVVEELLVS